MRPRDASTVDLAGGWNSIWGVFNSTLGGVAGLFAVIGVFIIVGAVLKWLWSKRRGGGQGGNGVLIAILIGGIIAAPGLIIPLVLKGIDYILNFCVSLWNAVVK